MKPFFLKYYIVALIFINATFLFSQNTSDIDSLIQVVNTNIELEEYTAAHNLIDALKTKPSYAIDSIKLKVDYAEAILLKSQGKDDLSLEILLNGLSIIKNDKSSKFIAEYAYEIGSGFSKIKNYPKAFEYFRLVFENSKFRNDSLNLSRGYLALGSMHLHLVQDSRGGLVELLDSISDKKHKDSIQFFYSKSLDILPQNKMYDNDRAEVYANLLVYHYYEANYKEAEKYGVMSLNIHEKVLDSVEMARDYNLLGAITYQEENYEKTKEYYFSGLELVRRSRSFEAVEMKERFLENLSSVHFLTGDYKEAYEYGKSSFFIKDSLNLANSKEKYVEYEAKYNLSEQEKLAEIEKNKKEKALFWLYVLGVSSIVLIFVLWLTNRSQKLKRDKQELEFQKENLLQERKIETVKNDAQIKILNATIDGKETERNYIAQILHDSVSALLSSAGLHLQAARIELDGKAPEEIEKSQAIVKEAGEKIRDLSHKLISSVLLKFGLSYAMEDMCEKYSNSKLTFETDAKDVQRFNREFEIKIHSIIEELINNIIKHSNAESAHILLKQFDGNLQVRIFDDGRGFDVDKMRANNAGGLGLTQIEARIKVMDGIFNINSSEETGTRIFINVPILDEQLN